MVTLTPGDMKQSILGTPASVYQNNLDIDPNRGYLAHFFRRDEDPNEGNAGRAYLNKALEKQRKFD